MQIWVKILRTDTTRRNGTNYLNNKRKNGAGHKKIKTRGNKRKSKKAYHQSSKATMKNST